LLFAERLDPALLNRMRDCLQTGTPFGNDVFREEIERTLGKSVGFSIRGRPRKPPSEGDAENRTPDAQQLPLSGI
jgi:hypothetical protein